MIGKQIIRFFFVWVLFSQCSCDRGADQVPYVPVDIVINLNLPEYQMALFPVGGWAYITGGSRGIIVYHRSIDEFMAYDRHAPFNVDDGCQVVVKEDNIVIEDPCSGSQWVIIDGSIIGGPAAQSLLQYDVIYNDPYVQIFN
jgi:hypothetical protein